MCSVYNTIKLYINYGIIKHAGGEGARRALIFRILIVCEGAGARRGPRRAPLCFLRHGFLCNIIIVFNFVKCFGVLSEKSGSRKSESEVRKLHRCDLKSKYSIADYINIKIYTSKFCQRHVPIV